MSDRERVIGRSSQGRKGSAQRMTAEGEKERGGWGYLCEGERVGHRADEDLTQLPIQVRTLDSVQVGIYPEDPAGFIRSNCSMMSSYTIINF